MRPSRLVALGLAAAAVSAAGAAAQSSSAPFTAAERRRLRAGELVKREVTRSEGPYHLVGGTSWQRVDAPLERVWQLVRDPRHYPRIIPSLTHVRVVGRDGSDRVIHMEHRQSLATAEYYARVHLDEADHRVRFELDRGRPHDVRAGRGFIALSPYHGDTIVAWGVLADIGGGILQHVFGPTLNEWLLEVPRCVRNQIEHGHSGC